MLQIRHMGGSDLSSKPTGCKAMSYLTAVVAAVAAGALAAAGPASARPPQRPHDAVASVITAVTGCVAITDNTARLACFDGATAKLVEATAKGDVKIVDREDIRATRRSLFGFTLPHVAFFKGDDTAEDTPSEIDTTIKSVGNSEYGKFTLTMDDGAVWKTTEPLPRDPRAGMPVHLKRGALGNYFIRVGAMRSVTAQRVR